MNHRISAGALVFHEDRILMVRHYRQDRYDFWVAPGGGVQDGEDARSAAAREALEEAGVLVEPQKIAVIEELENPHEKGCKLWFLCEMKGGELSTEPASAEREGIVDVQFLSRRDLASKVAFPPIVNDDDFWDSVACGFPEVKYLGLNQMEFF